MYIITYQGEAISLPSSMESAMSTKVYEIITSKIIESLEKDNILPWRKPFSIGSSLVNMNFITKKQYNGINAIMTTLQAFPSPYWLTFKQAQTKKMFLNKGEKGTPIIFWQWIEDEDNKDNNGNNKKIPICKYYTVFNLSQFKDWEKVCPEEHTEITFTDNPIEAGEEVVNNYPNPPKFDFNVQGKAYYVPSMDLIKNPPRKDFNSVEEYYSTLFHEMIHSSGHESRLSRKGIVSATNFGTEKYAFEELVAEIGSAFLCNHSRIEGVYDNSIAYLNSWKKKFKDDPSIIPKAAQQAMKAANHILGIKPFEKEETEE